MNTRRRFLHIAPIAPLAAAGLWTGSAQAQEMVDEKAGNAVALGYVADAAKVDKAKQPKYVAGASCANCQLYQGKAGSPSGPCPIFPGKQVAAKGWCSAYVKKAG